jgi:S-DNA-T family DNA segregation ATPase FtsK/SpoIIIE
MAIRKRKLKKNKKVFEREMKSKKFVLPEEIRRWIFGVIMFLAAVVVGLAFFDMAGLAGRYFVQGFSFLIGKTIFVFPLLFILCGIAFFIRPSFPSVKNTWLVGLSLVILILGITGILGVLTPEQSDVGQRYGGLLGHLLSWPALKVFGFLAGLVIFAGIIIVGAVIMWYFLSSCFQRKEAIVKEKKLEIEEKPCLIKRIFAPKFEVKEVEPVSFAGAGGEGGQASKEKDKGLSMEIKTKSKEDFSLDDKEYQRPSLDLLETDKGAPTSGDIKINSAIIKRTLQNFDIPIEVSEVNIGPTVTQYTFKPAEGIKLSRITALSNDLALALAARSIRIEAPIPGRPLAGIEIPNKTKTLVRLRNLLEHTNFQNAFSPLFFALGRDVAGNSVFADLARMPHLLVAGSTGTGKTICLNTIILSLLYRNSPESLRLILVDPKRVEFGVYNGLPHLLTPVIFDVQKTVNVLKWLIGEMERRFDVLSEAKAKDINSYNAGIATSPLPYIVLVIDELADLMAARGREIEAAIVRLAQMARAVGIHLVVATQRPSVEVITGLIKANITARITFQVASQVDSRTVLDMAGAEKLLGCGDMLFVSAEISKPKRIQGAFISEKEVKKVAKYIAGSKVQTTKSDEQESEEKDLKDKLAESAKEILEGKGGDSLFGEEDPLYEEAKRVVIESKKASASLLQRRLRLGYARAARLIDTLEDRGVVGPGEGAKPREVYADNVEEEAVEEKKDEKENDEWVKV